MDFIKNILGLLFLPIVAVILIILYPLALLIGYTNYKINRH